VEVLKKGPLWKSELFFISLKDLIRNKKAANRKQNQADLELLTRRSGK